MYKTAELRKRKKYLRLELRSLNSYTLASLTFSLLSHSLSYILFLRYIQLHTRMRYVQLHCHAILFKGTVRSADAIAAALILLT